MDEKNKQQLEEILVTYKELFGLQNWHIALEIKDHIEHNAKTIADPRYYLATIEIDKSIEQEFFTEIIVHELIHIIMSLYDFYADNLGKEGSQELFYIARENAVSQLTHIVLRLLKK